MTDYIIHSKRMESEVHVEVLSRLNLANVTIVSNILTDINTIVAQGSVIRINTMKINCRDLIFKTNSLEVRRGNNEAGIWFRLPLDSGGLETGAGQQVDLVLDNREALLRNLFPSSGANVKPDLTVGNEYEVQCQQCQTLITRLVPERILPMPSSGWRQVSAEWFCCSTRHQHQSAVNGQASAAGWTVSPRRQDLIYGQANFVLNREDVPDDKLVFSQEENVTKCSKCFNELGEANKDCLYFWYCATILQSADSKTSVKKSSSTDNNMPDPTLCESELEASGNNSSKVPIMTAVQTPEENFSSLVCSRIADSSGRMPVFRFRCGSTAVSSPSCKAVSSSCKAVKIWGLDKSLACFRSRKVSSCDSDLNLSRETVVKVAFHVEESDSDKLCSNLSFLDKLPLEEEVRVSEKMFENGVKLLQDSCRYFPKECKFVTDKQVAYLSAG